MQEGVREADNIKSPVGACQTLLRHCPSSISQWSTVGFWNLPCTNAEGTAVNNTVPSGRGWGAVLESPWHGSVWSLSQVRCSTNKAEKDAPWLRFNESFQVNFVNTVTANSVFALSYSKHKSVLFIWWKTKQKHSLRKSRENKVPKALYILAHNTFTFFLANGMQLVSNSKTDNGKNCLQ